MTLSQVPPLENGIRVHGSGRAVVVAVAVATATLLGITIGLAQVGGIAPVQTAYAACGNTINCGADNTATSALTVQHIYYGSATPVEPDTSETLAITATWASLFGGGQSCDCTETTASVGATVTWTGSGWSVSCSGCNPTSGPIRSLTVCSALSDTCTSHGTTHGWKYTLVVDVNHTKTVCTNTAAFLHHVDYTATSVDDGDTIDTSSCVETGSLSLYGGTDYSATDNGAFECAFDCSAAGPTLTLYYQ
jgi:hypothetical protein